MHTSPSTVWTTEQVYLDHTYRIGRDGARWSIAIDGTPYPRTAFTREAAANMARTEILKWRAVKYQESTGRKVLIPS